MYCISSTKLDQFNHHGPPGCTAHPPTKSTTTHADFNRTAVTNCNLWSYTTTANLSCLSFRPVWPQWMTCTCSHLPPKILLIKTPTETVGINYSFWGHTTTTNRHPSFRPVWPPACISHPLTKCINTYQQTLLVLITADFILLLQTRDVYPPDQFNHHGPSTCTPTP